MKTFKVIMPTVPLSLNSVYRVEYEIDDATTDEEGYVTLPDPRASIPLWSVNYGAAIVAVCRAISPIYAKIAVGIINPRTEAGAVRHLVINIKRIKDMLTAVEHLAKAGKAHISL